MFQIINTVALGVKIKRRKLTRILIFRSLFIAQGPVYAYKPSRGKEV